MAADGGWPNGLAPEEPGGARSPRAAAQLRGVLSDLQRRLSLPGSEALPPHAAAALAETLDALARRLERGEAAAAGRDEALGTMLQALVRRLDAQAERQAGLEHRFAAGEARIQARLEGALAELAAVRATQAEPDPAPIRLVLAAAALAAALSVMGAGAILLAQPQVITRPLASLRDLATPNLGLRPSLRPQPPAPRGLAAAQASALPVTPPSPASSRETYETVAAALERGEPTALPRLTGLAQAGNAPAQLALAGLYEAGGAGLPRDLAAARQWTRAAADGGDRVAMYNLGLFLSEGAGGGRDYGEAAAWFRRAADRGVVDAQYNLALLYEAGRGVEKNLREAYRWFAVAANAGDAAAREKQVEVEARLKAGERSGLDREVSGFRPGAATPADLAAVIPPAETLAETQALLARKGYYVGPVDGVASAAFRSAAAAYLRDHPEAAPTP